jgi:hypothetical protein
MYFPDQPVAPPVHTAFQDPATSPEPSAAATQSKAFGIAKTSGVSEALKASVSQGQRTLAFNASGANFSPSEPLDAEIPAFANEANQADKGFQWAVGGPVIGVVLLVALIVAAIFLVPINLRKKDGEEDDDHGVQAEGGRAGRGLEESLTGL